MNLPIEWFDEKSLTAEDYNPGQIVSLWDMLAINARSFVGLLTQLGCLSGMIEVWRDPGRKSDEIDTAGFKTPAVLSLPNSLRSMELKLSVMAAERFIGLLNRNDQLAIKTL
jgi:hypothetical protein